MGGRGGIGRRSGLKIRFPQWSAGSIPAVRTILAAILLSGCSSADDPNRTDISIIGGPPRLGDPDRDALDVSRNIVMRETAMGLVTLDATGQVEPALAESWIVTDDGLSTIFRIHRVAWPDGSEVTGDEVAASLKRAMAPSSENRLKPLLSAVDAVVGMTGRVVEIRLKVPRPNLLQLLAQPELGIRRQGTGLGPWRITGREGNAMVLRPVTTFADASLDDAPEAKRVVHLKGGRAALAVARFQSGKSDLVLGGTLNDWPIVQAARVKRAALRLDPAEGLFGLAIIPEVSFLKEKDLRAALAMAIDRGGLIAMIGAERWTPMERLLPIQLDSGQPATSPDWTTLALADRQNIARQRVAAWVSARGKFEPLRLALPQGPGMRLLFARIRSDWRGIGVEVVRVAARSKDADIRLIDEVAPNSSANWYLTRTGCGYRLSCSPVGDLALQEARVAPSLGKRSAAIARADAAYAENAGYIPLAKPLRWSLVAPALTGFRDNAFAVHPFNQLRPN